MKEIKQPPTTAGDAGTEFNSQWTEQNIGRSGDDAVSQQSLGSGIKTGSGVEEHGGQDLAITSPDALLRALASHARLEQSLANQAVAELAGRPKAVAQTVREIFGHILEEIERQGRATGIRIPQDMSDMDRRRLAYVANHAGREFERIYVSRLIRAVADWQEKLAAVRSNAEMSAVHEIAEQLSQDFKLIDAEVHAIANTV